MTETIKPETTEWEAVCARCGQCCHEKIDFEGRIYYTALPCEFLDPDTRRCTVYDQRETARPGCVKLTPETVAKGFLPANCPYVKDLEGYNAPVLQDEE